MAQHSPTGTGSCTFDGIEHSHGKVNVHKKSHLGDQSAAGWLVRRQPLDTAPCSSNSKEYRIHTSSRQGPHWRGCQFGRKCLFSPGLWE